MTERRYFTRQEARLLVGRRVQARVAMSRPALRNLGLWVTEGGGGRVLQMAAEPRQLFLDDFSDGNLDVILVGPGPADYLVGVRWDDPRPAATACFQPALVRAPRYAACPLDWYTEDEFRSLLEAAVEQAA